jgi:fructosamine-3-kinase
MIPQEITDSLADFFLHSQHDSVDIIKVYPLSGGCINSVQRLQTSKGDFCVKYNFRERFPGMFVSEADGLASLRSSGEIRVPEVYTAASAGAYDYILLEYVDSGRKIPAFMQDFGRSLARMHRHSSSEFGYANDNYMGSLLQSNKKHTDWTSFFIEERLVKQISLAHGNFTASNYDSFERLYARLDELLPKEPPALLHGDLWGGNYMVADNGKACLIDPAVYCGHREVDIAMTTLFGGFDEAFYASYNEEYPLVKGWQERLDIFKLYPLLIHLNLFGSGYLGSILDIIRKY